LEKVLLFTTIKSTNLPGKTTKYLYTTPLLLKKKKKVVVVEDSSSETSSEEEVVVRRKKIKKAKDEPTPRAVEAVVSKPEPAPPRTTGSRVLDKLFFNK
jgi:hypothetical protein